MGVKGLWRLLEPVGRPVTLESLEGKVLSVDASILLNQAVKGMRDRRGNPLPNAHLVVLFNRLCKLLFYRIKPIFIFDGGVPILKKKTLAVRRERKFKAKHGSNKATEKLVKNYLKGKALETVTGRKSSRSVFRNDSPRDPDIFELPPISFNQGTMQESSSEAEEEEELQPFYGQHDFEKKFQDPSSINVDSQDFRSLPEEIQHELIKEVMDERKWTTIQSMPQDAFGFSDYQLQNVLQRGKLHQRLDELRKEMNNRNTGEVSGLSSQQDALGIDSSVLSQRIVSEDSGHYVLIKTSRPDSKENQDSPMSDGLLTEGGFFREDQESPPQRTKASIHPKVPSFDVDLTCRAVSSDSEPDVPMLDVPEVVIFNLEESNEKREEESHAKTDDGRKKVITKKSLQNQREEKFNMNKERKRDVKDEGRKVLEGGFDTKEVGVGKTKDGGKKVMVIDSVPDQDGDVLSRNITEITKMNKNNLDSDSEDNVPVKDDSLHVDKTTDIKMEETLGELKLDEDEGEESESIEARIERRRCQIEMLLSKRESQSEPSTRREVCGKTMQGDESSQEITSGEDDAKVLSTNNASVLPADDGTVEFRLHIESSSDDEEDYKDKIPSRDDEVMDNQDRRENVEVTEDAERDQEKLAVSSRDDEVMDNQDRRENVEVTEDAEQGQEKLAVSSRDDEVMDNQDRRENVEITEDAKQDQEKLAVSPKDDEVPMEDAHQGNQESATVPSRELSPEVMDKKVKLHEEINVIDTQLDNEESLADKEEHSSNMTEGDQVLDNRQKGLREEVMEEKEEQEMVVKGRILPEEEMLVPDEKPVEEGTRSVPTPSEFAGTSKEDLEVMQVNLEVEQQSLQSERARQERMAATVSNEMLTESQELLRLFGVPYLVSPMEAEAQCAFLDSTDQTCGTITDDSDVFLFGGTRVYKNIFNQNKHAELYTIDAITGHLALDRSKMINLAFITGSDYTEGIQGLGAVGAMEVLHEFDSEGFEALIKFKKWHEETKKNKKSAHETHVKQKLRRVTLPSGFPSQEVFDSYISPVIDESREPFEWGKPDLHGLRLFAKEKLGWSAAKTDEILLPVLKQLNQQEHQMRMEDFFQIKFHEPRKKPSRRVRRVVNRFLNPLSSSDSSSSEDEAKSSSGSQSSSRKERGKQSGSRSIMAASRGTRGIGRGRGQSRGRRATVKDGNTKRGCSDRDVNDRSEVESGTIITDGNEDGSTSVDREPKKEGRKTGKRNIVGKGQISKQEFHMEKKGKGIINEDGSGRNLKPQADHNDTNNERYNLLNKDNNVSMVQRNNVKTQRYKIPKKTSKATENESGSSGLGNKNENSSTSSDSDSEGARLNWISSANLSRTNKNVGRGVGRKRTRGRGRGRGAAMKRTKIEKMA